MDNVTPYKQKNLARKPRERACAGIYATGAYSFEPNIYTISTDRLDPVSATQSSTWDGHGAELAIDGNSDTYAQTACSTGEEWLNITLPKVACIDQVNITNSHSGNDALRMYGTKIMVADSTEVYLYRVDQTNT